jgi:anti-sigma B factor antagonist
MKYEITENAEAVIVAVHGDIDLAHSAQLRTALMECVGRGQTIIVDLANVTVIDSSGVASLLEACQGARKRGKRFVLAGGSESVKRVLKLARLDKVFSLAETVQRALEK